MRFKTWIETMILSGVSEEQCFKSTRKSWTTGSIDARQYALEKRGAILHQVSLLHQRDLDQLAVLRSRIQNSSQRIDRLPDDVLLHVFSMTLTENFTPETLASVCHRWMTLVFGGASAGLWCTIDININCGSTVALAERVTRCIERSRTRPLALILRGKNVILDEAINALLLAVARPSFPRIRKMVVESFASFGLWFPLAECFPSLQHLSLEDLPFRDSEHPDEIRVLASPCPSLRHLDLLPSSSLSNSRIQSILRNVSATTSITHLNIRATKETSGIHACLSSFKQLEFLRWRSFGPTNELAAVDTSTVPLSLPNLKTLVIAGNVVFALSELDAPLVQVIHIGDDFEGADYWGLNSPARFLALRKLTFVYPLWGTDYDADALFDHPNLEEATWVLYPPDLVALVRTVSLRLSQQPTQSSLCGLKWLNLVCPAPFDELYHPTDEECDLDLVVQLKSLFVYRNAHSTNSLHFQVRLNYDLVNISPAIAALVADHPDIIVGDVDWMPPDSDQ